MPETIAYSGTLVVETCWCGTTHAVPAELVAHQRRRHDNGGAAVEIYCPLGHAWIRSGEGKAARLQRELDEAQAQLTATRDQLDAAERERRRLAKRAAGGACPCCNRTFVQLARHMKVRHPDYAAEGPR